MSTFPPSDRPFSTRPLLVSWIVPVALFTIGGLPLLAFPGRADVLVVCGLLLFAGAVASTLLFVSRILVADGLLIVRYRSLRSVRLRLYDVQTVSTRRGRFSRAPALVIGARDGTRVSIWLGTWRHEEELLAILAQAADRARASVETEAEEILRNRPSASTWQQAAAPRTSIGRWFSRLPGPVRWVAQLGLYGILVVGFSIGMAQAARFSETVLFPRHVDAAWAAPVGVVSKRTPGSGTSRSLTIGSSWRHARTSMASGGRSGSDRRPMVARRGPTRCRCLVGRMQRATPWSRPRTVRCSPHGPSEDPWRSRSDSCCADRSTGADRGRPRPSSRSRPVARSVSRRWS